MAMIVLALLLGVVVAALIYPFLVPQASMATARVTDRDVERAVYRLRAARGSDLQCPACGQPYLSGDRFCVKCGADLPGGAAEPPGREAPACPQCGASLRPGDVFCSKCGHRLATGEGL